MGAIGIVLEKGFPLPFVRMLLQPLPVRHRDFVKNIKKQYAKTLHILQVRP